MGTRDGAQEGRGGSQGGWECCCSGIDQMRSCFGSSNAFSAYVILQEAQMWKTNQVGIKRRMVGGSWEAHQKGMGTTLSISGFEWEHQQSYKPSNASVVSDLCLICLLLSPIVCSTSLNYDNSWQHGPASQMSTQTRRAYVSGNLHVNGSHTAFYCSK